MSKILRITEHDKAHESSKACAGAIGFNDDVRGKRVLNIYTRFSDKTNVDFYPMLEDGIYLADPFEKKQYLAYETYYSFLKKAKAAELMNIAQDLGAKYIKITWNERENKFTSKSKQVKEAVEANGQGTVSGTYNHLDESKSSKAEDILYESHFPGSSPVRPELKYFKLDSQINTLIDLRLNEDNPLESQDFVFEQRNTCGIKLDDAIAIDAAIKKYNIATEKANVSFKIQTEKEFRSFFKYTIKF